MFIGIEKILAFEFIKELKCAKIHHIVENILKTIIALKSIYN